MSPQQRELLAASGLLVAVSQVAKLTPYSAGYLSLLARQGKLSAVKINRDWLTTPGAVLEYVKKQELKHQKLAESLKAVEKNII